MEKEVLKQFLSKKSPMVFFATVFAGLLMVVSLAGIIWVAGGSQRTIFGEKIIRIEKRIEADKKTMARIIPMTEKEKSLKNMGLRYVELSWAQNFIIRQLIDLGFLGFLFWNGIFSLSALMSHRRFTKKLQGLMD